jgi:DNA-binding PadR family transcriptional regulator
MKKHRAEKPKKQTGPSNGRGHWGPPNILGPWGRGASEHRPGRFTKQYLIERGETYGADIYRALSDNIERLNQERIEIGEKPFRRPNYSSFCRYFHWFLMLGLVERTGKREPAIYSFLQKRVFFRLTDKGKAEIKAWEDPIAVVHPEFRLKT